MIKVPLFSHIHFPEDLTSHFFIHPALSNVYAFSYHVSCFCTPHPPQLLLYCSVTFRKAHRIE